MSHSKVLHLNISDASGGVGRAAYRLHCGLNAAGFDSWMWVDHKSTDDPKVLTPLGTLNQQYSRIRSRVDKWPSLLCNTEHWEYASFNYLPNPSVKDIWKKIRPDIIHLHWIGDGLLPLQYFPDFADIPTVATLHGRWLFNGAQHLHSDQSSRFIEGFLPDHKDINDRGIDVDRWVWKRKKRYFKCNPFEVIALSRWMGKDARKSELLKERKIHLVPNGLNLKTYCPGNALGSRKHFSLPENIPLLLFGANFATRDRNKGFQDFVDAVRVLENELNFVFEVVVFGSERPEGDLPYLSNTHFLGYLKDEREIVHAYNACDCFVLPSHQDNLPNTVMEALACGTPCVAYDVGGVSDMVENDKNGYLVEPRNSHQLADRIFSVLSADDEKKNRFSNAATEKIQSEFSLELQVKRMIDIYESLISGNKAR